MQWIYGSVVSCLVCRSFSPLPFIRPIFKEDIFSPAITCSSCSLINLLYEMPSNQQINQSTYKLTAGQRRTISTTDLQLCPPHWSRNYKLPTLEPIDKTHRKTTAGVFSLHHLHINFQLGAFICHITLPSLVSGMERNLVWVTLVLEAISLVVVILPS